MAKPLPKDIVKIIALESGGEAKNKIPIGNPDCESRTNFYKILQSIVECEETTQLLELDISTYTLPGSDSVNEDDIDNLRLFFECEHAQKISVFRIQGAYQKKKNVGRTIENRIDDRSPSEALSCLLKTALEKLKNLNELHWSIYCPDFVLKIESDTVLGDKYELEHLAIFNLDGISEEFLRSLKNAKNLQGLIIVNCGIESFDVGILPESVTALYLGGKKLRSLKGFKDRKKNAIKIIDLSESEGFDNFDFLDYAKQVLVRLNLSQMNLKEIPQNLLDLSEFPNLESLDLSENEITGCVEMNLGHQLLPPMNLEMSSNPITEVKLEGARIIKEIHLDNCDLKKVPVDLFSRRGLQLLDLDRNDNMIKDGKVVVWKQNKIRYPALLLKIDSGQIEIREAKEYKLKQKEVDLKLLLPEMTDPLFHITKEEELRISQESLKNEVLQISQESLEEEEVLQISQESLEEEEVRISQESLKEEVLRILRESLTEEEEISQERLEEEVLRISQESLTEEEEEEVLQVLQILREILEEKVDEEEPTKNPKDPEGLPNQDRVWERDF